MNYVYAKEIIVKKNTSVSSIQQAINLSSNGDVILIKEGTYFENNILVNKSVKITGEAFPAVDGRGKGEIFSVKAKGVVISGLVVQNTGFSYVKDFAGIKIYNTINCTIENNKLINTCYGIFLNVSDSCIIKNNSIIGSEKSESKAGNAIHLFHCNHLLIQSNTTSHHRDGIYLEFVTESKISENISEFHIRYGMHFMFSHNCEYFQNRFENNGAGVAIMYSKNIYVHNNIFDHNWSAISYGILLKSITDSRIEKNKIEENTAGIYAEGCDRNKIENNEFKNNGWALKILGDCEDNFISGNNFLSNTFEVATNSTANHNKFEKNFWSNYSGYDLNKDGIGDEPHSPVTLFTYVVERNSTTIILLHSLFIDLLNLAEKITPVITPETLKDLQPLMKPLKRNDNDHKSA